MQFSRVLLVSLLKQHFELTTSNGTQMCRYVFCHLHDLYSRCVSVNGALSFSQLCRGMFNSTILECLSFVKPYHKLQGMEILQDMFNSHAVQHLLQVCPRDTQDDLYFVCLAQKHHVGL